MRQIFSVRRWAWGASVVTLAAVALWAALPTTAGVDPAALAQYQAQQTPQVSPARPSGIIAQYTLTDVPLGVAQNAVLPGSIANDRTMLLGGTGSDLWHGPNDAPDEFWMISDRGPNGQIKVGTETRRTFPVPDFTPVILQVKASGGTVTVLKTIPIVGQSGKPVTGISNLDRDETPYDYSAQTKLPFNPNGLDTEGIVRTANGDFWLCEEYGPSIVHVDAAGKVIKRYVPEGIVYTGTDYPTVSTLPAIFGKRKINRGFEGITLSGDGATLFVVLQSPLTNPDKKTGDASRNTRIIRWDIATEKTTAEYVFRFQPATDFGAKTTPDEMKSSALAWVNATTLLVEERTDDLAKLYTVDLSQATNILGTKWDDPATTPTLEATDDLAATGIVALPKTLVLDLGTFKDIPKKVEGVVILDKNTVAISNDNDFDIGDFDADGNNIASGTKNRLLVIALPNPLP